MGELQNKIGYREIWDDKANKKAEDKGSGKEGHPTNTNDGDNFTSFDKGKIRADMTSPDSVMKPIEVNLKSGGEVTVDAGKGTFNPKLKYKAVYKNFGNQMQTGHVYGNFNSSAVGDVSRMASVYVEGNLTNLEDMKYLSNKKVNDGRAEYEGQATYMENLHLGSNSFSDPITGKSKFDVDFANKKVAGTLKFDGKSDIAIGADIKGNTFKGMKGKVDTAGGFYGEDAKYLGGIYQQALEKGGKGTTAGSGTTFQGTYGAEKK